MDVNQGRVTGFGAISQEDARETERLQAILLEEELNSLSMPKDKERISIIKNRLEAIRRLAESKD
ncbi:hypothetical protein [Bacteroides clarus]|uniref:Uncharacterized protein n=1 Tax=Bacteroides clarus TaxID=626929 RepID=A0A412Y8R4_9BACE|nr:hypothetical protein [Bacteroides clarus]RGV37022.1 hypothetical protein DWW16_10670 [Bacteroides clarus]RGV53867.1 hypothetical protein DWW09_09820 [Bacteroides clarus]